MILFGIVCAEPPTNSYLPPLASGSGAGYSAVNSGYQDSEGIYLDPHLLHKIEEILLDQENQASSHGGHGHGGLSVPQSSYGPPPSSSYLPPTTYGVPSFGSSRVVGVRLGNS